MSAVVSVSRLTFPWPAADPFLFCAHHDDHYPAGDERMAPAASLAGRDLGQDFGRKDGWSMYHGEVVPGFPQHPHRGFETVTLVRRGLIDHSDSLGARARFGHGDVQWITAGKGIVHAEMFPLLDRERANPLELFQIWLNLPARNKMADPHFSMFWKDAVPRHVVRDAAGRATHVEVVAGELGDTRPPAPPPRSWAAQPGSEVSIITLRLEPGATFTLPASSPGVNRTLYFFRGPSVTVDDRELTAPSMVRVAPGVPVPLTAGPAEVEILLLGGKPIGEPVAQYGPFVMNTRRELEQAFQDYQRTQFGGWPWPKDDPVHGRDQARFARYPDGREETAP